MDEDARRKFECMIDLARMGFDRLNQRRRYEWQVNFGFWAVIGILIGSWFKIDFTVLAEGYLFCGLVFLGGASYAIWIGGLQLSNKIDQKFAFYYEVMAEEFAFGKRFPYESVCPKFTKHGGARLWSIISQALFTLCLLIILVLLYWPSLKW